MAHEYVKISELEPTTSFGTTDQFVIVQNDETVKIVGADLVQSLATLTNLATRSYVDAVVDSAPGTLDTLRELATALNDDANFGANITALINEKLPTANFGLEFWNQLATVNTYHISEGSNLYWTQDRFNEAFATKNTYHLAEGSNLYFTTARAREALSAGEGILYNSLTGVISAPGLSSDPTFNSVTTTTLNVKNVNFTGTGAVTISSGNDLNLVAAGHVAVNGSPLVASATVDTTNAANISSGTLSNARLNAIPNSVLANSTITINGTTISLGGTNSISTSSISEGTNLYYTSGRVNADFDTRLTTKSTTDLAEGTNLYYTDARVDSYLTSNNYATKGYVGTQIANLVNSAPTTLDTLNELATALGNDANFATTVTTALGTKLAASDFNLTFDNRLATKSTTNLSEGTNLYYTDARTRSAFSGGSNISYNSNTGVIAVTGLATVATSGSYNDLTNNPTQWQDVSSYVQTGYTFNEPAVGTGANGGPGSTTAAGQLVTHNWASYTNEAGVYAYYPGANFANGNIPNPAVQDIKTFAINYQYASGGFSVPSATDWINWGNNLKNASASKFLIVKTTDGKQIVYEITSVTDDAQTNNSQVHQHTINVNFLKFNGGDPTSLIKNIAYPPKIFWVGNVSANILNYYLDLSSVPNLTNNIVVVAGSNTRIAMPNASTYPGRTIDITNKSLSSLLQIELDLPNNILSDYILLNTFSTFKSNGTRWIPVSKVLPNYVQADKASTSIPYGTALPATVVSGTITTTGGPVRLHISGNCTVNTGGNPVIQFQRGTTGVGRNMTLSNNGSNLPFASECIDAVPAGTYTYSVKVVSGSIGNGAIFYDPVLTIIELK